MSALNDMENRGYASKFFGQENLIPILCFPFPFQSIVSVSSLNMLGQNSFYTSSDEMRFVQPKNR